MRKVHPKFIVIIGVIFISFSSIMVKASTAPALVIASYRLLFTVLLVSPGVLVKNRGGLRNIAKKDLALCIISGVFLALHFATWISSIKFTSIASATVLVNTHPIFITIAMFLIFKEKVNRSTAISIIITLAGGVMISSGDSSLGSNIILGDMLAIFGGLFVSAYMIIGRIVRKRINNTIYTFIVYLSCAVTLFITTLFMGMPLYPYKFAEFAIFFCLALFCTILGHSIFNWALEFVKPTFVSISILGEPVFATLWAILIFSEIPKLYNIIGSLIIIFGIYLYTKTEELLQKTTS